MSLDQQQPIERLYSDISVGEIYEFRQTITQADVDGYAKLVRDFNPLHMDAEYGSKTEFGGRVVHGMLLAGQFSTLVGMYLPGKFGLYVSQDLKFLRPVMVEDTIVIRGEVIEKNDSLQLLTLKTEIINLKLETVVAGTAKVVVLNPFQETIPEVNVVDISLSNKVALISGASRGIGAATAILLAQHGAKIAVNYYRDEVSAKAVVEKISSFGGNAIAVKADVSRKDEVCSMLEVVTREIGAVDILINNASPEINAKQFSAGEWADYQRHLDVTVKGTYHCVHAVLNGMVSRNSGKIINVVTTYTMGVPPPNLGSYVTAKSALLGLTKVLAVELGPLGIQVNAVSPGLTDTALAASLPRRFKDVVASQSPLRRIATPEDVAKVILMLASEAGTFMTGVTVPVCGGHTMV